MLTIYKASAGSGKTYTLAKEYILQLLAEKTDPNDSKSYRLRKPGGNAHRSILAITFSNSATEEMKRRIIDELALLADPNSDSNYRTDFVKDYGFDPAKLAVVAHDALQNLLFDFSRFNVSTIDSFFQSVLRSFAREIDLSGNYEVELDQTMAVGIAVADMFTSLNNPVQPDRHLEEWILRYMAHNIDNGASFNLLNRSSSVHRSMVENISRLMDEDYRKNKDKIHQYFSDSQRLLDFEEALCAYIKPLKKKFKENAEALRQVLVAYGLLDGKNINSTVLNRMEEWASGKFCTKDDFGTTITEGKEPENISRRYYGDYLKAVNRNPPQAVDDAIITMLAEACDIFPKVEGANQILKNLYLFGLLGHVVSFIDEYRRENNTILISDTNEMLDRFIDDSVAPFIYERLGVYLHHFLIDEFQDTSGLQWKNLKPLIEESLANSHDNLIIGDEKQCIYRFRNSDPTLITSEVKKQIGPSRVNERGTNPIENTNRRSAPNIVKFNNTIFPAFATALGVQNTYANTVQSPWSRNSSYAGYVDLTFIEVPYSRKKSEEDDETYDQLTLQRLAENIRKQLQTGYRPKDIAVIVRVHREGQMVINYLLKKMKDEPGFFPRDFDITSREALLIASSPLVKLIISILRIIDTPVKSDEKRSDPAYQLAKLTNRFEYFFNNGELTATEALEKALDTSIEAQELTTDTLSTQLVNLHTIVEHIIGTFISEAQRADSNIFLAAFQDLVIDFCSHGQADVHSFLQWWDASGKSQRLVTPDDLDALTVVTIHASKGLQYKCVHIPFANWELTKSSTTYQRSFSWYKIPKIAGIAPEIQPDLMPIENVSNLQFTTLDRQYEDRLQEQRVDNLNIFYVATTRAVEQLLITCKRTIKASEDKKKKPAAGNTIAECLYNLLADPQLQLGHGDPATEVPIALNGNSVIIGTPITREQKQQLDAAKSAKTGDAPVAMPTYATTLNHQVWSLTRIDDVCDISDARERGTFFHDVLSHVRSRDDLELAVSRRAYRLGLTETAKEEMLQELNAAMADPRVSRWFDPSRRILTERTIHLENDAKARPDRVVWIDDDHIEVVDYKFGEHHNSYFKQVRDYINYISTIYPDATITGYLWYPEKREIKEVP